MKPEKLATHKFTNSGGVVRVALRRLASSLEISVTDTGLGIAPEFLPHVFERFRQADSSNTRHHAALGLGLAIVKEQVEVDDEQDARNLIEEMLRSSAADVVSAGSATDALIAMDRFQPDVLLSDIAMPEQDGYSLLAQVRSLRLEDGAEVPAIALTAFARPEDRARALAAGFQAHLAKPVEQRELLAAIVGVVASAHRDPAT